MLIGTTEPISTIAIDRAELLVGTVGGKVLRYSANLVPIREESTFREPILAIAPGSPSGGHSIVTREGSLYAITPLTHKLPIPTRDRLAWLAPLPDGGLATNDGSGRVMLLNHRRYSLATGDVGPVNAGIVTRDGQTLLTGGEDGVIRSWQLGSDLLHRSVRVGIDSRAIAVHPDGLQVMVSTPAVLMTHVATLQETDRSDHRTRLRRALDAG